MSVPVQGGSESAIIEKWKESVDNDKTFTALITNLSKAFDCLPLKLIIGQLNAHGFSLLSAKLIHSYSPNWKQRKRMNFAYSSWEEILFDVPQGSTIGLLLLNIFVCDLFSILSNIDFTNYSDDTTPYVIGNGSKEIINSLKNALDDLFCWFASNQMKANHNSAI